MEKIPSIGIPDKVTLKDLFTLDFKSSNDRSILPILKFLKFLDSSGIPTERYRKYRDKSLSKKVLGEAINEGYKDLFKVYPDASEKDHHSLHNFFSTHTGLGERAIKSIVETFKALCSMADLESKGVEGVFSEEASNENSEPRSSLHSIDLALSDGRKAKIILPQDITVKEIDKLKKLLDILK